MGKDRQGPARSLLSPLDVAHLTFILTRREVGGYCNLHFDRWPSQITGIPDADRSLFSPIQQRARRPSHEQPARNSPLIYHLAKPIDKCRLSRFHFFLQSASAERPRASPANPNPLSSRTVSKSGRHGSLEVQPVMLRAEMESSSHSTFPAKIKWLRYH